MFGPTPDTLSYDNQNVLRTSRGKICNCQDCFRDLWSVNIDLIISELMNLISVYDTSVTWKQKQVARHIINKERLVSHVTNIMISMTCKSMSKRMQAEFA